MIAYNPEVVVNFSLSFMNTKASLDLDICRTWEFLEVLFDKEKKVFCPSYSQDIEVDESIQPTRGNPKVLSDTELHRKDEDVDLLGNTNNVQDAFIFFPMMGTIQADKILEQGSFFSAKEMSQMEETRSSLYHKFTTITFEEKDSIKSKM